MAYSNFTLSKVKEDFALVTNEWENIFSDVLPIEGSKILSVVLEEQIPLARAINTEKARSELIIMPVLVEVRRILHEPIAIFSGSNFLVEPDRGLDGRCDFLLSRSDEQYYITSPVLTIVEAKNESIPSGLGQCAATMFAARLFKQREGQNTQFVYGAVTTGMNWQFLKLVDQTIYIDTVDYHISSVDKILGILSSTCQPAMQPA